MESLLLTDKEEQFFNKTALLHILFLIVLYLVTDIFLINYSEDVNAYSKGFYSKLVLCVLYLISSKEKSLTIQTNKSIQAPFHFSVTVLCIWMGVMSFIFDNVGLSRFTGVFLLFGGLSCFNLIEETIKVTRLKIKESTLALYFIETILKIILFSIFCFSVYFLITGEWQWDIKPFYEW
jgi:hypothetical protein